MAIDNEYFDRYERIVYEIGKAYKDVNILNTIERINANKKFDSKHPSFSILCHLTELAKADLGLTIYKLYFDNSHPDSNTIQHFNTYSHQKGSKKRVKISFSDTFKSIEKPLRDLRKSYLAHFESTPSYASVTINDLKRALDEITCTISEVADDMIDERIYPISENVIKITEYQDFMGLIELLNPMIIKEENSNGK